MRCSLLHLGYSDLDGARGLPESLLVAYSMGPTQATAKPFLGGNYTGHGQPGDVVY